jgi:DMSO reductase anchor subunit
MIGILITLLVACLVGGLIWWGFNYVAAELGFPAPIVKVVRVILVVIFVLYAIGMLTGTGGLAPLRIG